MLEAACRSCPDYLLSNNLILQGLPKNSKEWDRQLLPYFRHCHLLNTIGPVVLVNGRPVVPQSLQARVIDHVNSSHPGLSAMSQRLSSTLYWPDYREDLLRAKLKFPICIRIAPSNRRVVLQ